MLTVSSGSRPDVRFEQMGAARTMASKALGAAKSYTTAAASEPHLSGPTESTFPLFQWRLLYRRQQRYSNASDRHGIPSAACPAAIRRAKREGACHRSAILRQVGPVASECAECYQQFEQDIYAVNLGSKQSHRKRAAIMPSLRHFSREACAAVQRCVLRFGGSD